MADSVERISHKEATPPGSLIPVGVSSGEETHVTLFKYDSGNIREEEELGDMARLDALEELPGVLWVRVRGLTDISLIQTLGDRFKLHPLVLEDVLNTVHRPKLEEFSGYLFAVTRRLAMDPETRVLSKNQVALVLGKGWLISFEEGGGTGALDPMSNRLRNGLGRARQLGAGYLFYALMDLAADSYFGVLENLQERLEVMEESVMTEPNENNLNDIYQAKRQVMRLRRVVWPMREMANALLRDGHELLDHQVRPFLRDLYDHTTQVLEATEALMENLSSLMELCLSHAGNRMNQIMKVLTVIATIFIPLTFIAGVYGMNFKHMPELDLRWAYPALLALMGILGGGMALYFKFKKWL